MKSMSKGMKIAFFVTLAIAAIAIDAIIVLMIANGLTSGNKPTTDPNSQAVGTAPTVQNYAPEEDNPAEIPYQFDLENYVAAVYGMDVSALSSISPAEYVEYEKIMLEKDSFAEIAQQITDLQPTLSDKLGPNIQVSCKVVSHSVIPSEKLLHIAESAAIYGVSVDSIKYGYTVDFSVTISGRNSAVVCPTAQRTMLLINNRWYCAAVEENVTFPLEPYVYFFGLSNVEKHPFSTTILDY